MDNGFDLALGSYDAEVSGLHLWEDSSQLLNMKAQFAYRPHSDNITQLSFHDNTLASASADETVKIYDVSTKREGVTLLGHNGSVNKVGWANDSGETYLLSGGDDGIVCLWRKRDWKLIKELRGSGSSITGMAVHPSSKVVVSIGKDGKLNMWDLIKGKVAFSAKLKMESKKGWDVVWEKGKGGCYALWNESMVAVYSAAGKLVRTLECENEVCAVEFVSSTEILTAGDGKEVRLWDLKSQKQAATCAVHEHGIRGLAVVSDTIISGDSHGGLKVWDKRRNEVRIETKFGRGMRLTCMAATKRATSTINGEQKMEKNGETERNGQMGKKRKMGKNGKSEKNVADNADANTASKRKRQKRKRQLQESKRRKVQT